MGAPHHPQNKKRLKFSCKETQCLPVLSAAFAAVLTEGKNVEQMETMGLFFSALANDIFLIASNTDKRDIIIEEIIL